MEVSQTSTLYFGNFEVVQLSNFTQVGLSYPALGGQQATDELDRVVPQSRRERIPEDGAAIVEALLAQRTTKVSVVVNVSTCTRS
jgi:hypothetical protein